MSILYHNGSEQAITTTIVSFSDQQEEALVPDQSQVLRVTLFGCPRVIQPHLGVSTALGQKANELLALLLLRGHHSHHREKLATTLWSESSPESAAHSFRTTLWRLRRALEPPGVAKGTYLSASRPREIAFNWESDHSVDVLEFENTLGLCSRADVERISDAELQAIESALRLYEGELLEGHFDDWIIYERERLRDLFIRGLSYLMQAFSSRREYHQSITCGRRVLTEDPLRESVHRDLMALYVQVGQRAEAIKLYEQLRTTLDKELAVAPSKETTRAYSKLVRLDGETRHAPPVPPAGQITAAMDSLRDSLHTLELEQHQMTRTLDVLKTLLARRDDAGE